MSQLLTFPNPIQFFIAVRGQDSQSWSLHYNNAIGKGDTFRLVLTEVLDVENAITDKTFNGAPVTVNGVNIEFNADISLSFTVDVAGLQPNVALYEPVLRFRLIYLEDTSFTYDFDLTIEVNILTAIVFPEVIRYEVQGGTRANSTILNPTPMIQVFNSLCDVSVTYRIIPGGDCGINGIHTGPIPSWLDFDSDNILTEEYSIEGGRGLPDSQQFSLDFTNITRDPLATKAEEFGACLTFNMSLGSDLTIIKTVFIAVTTIRPCLPGTFSATGQDGTGCQPCDIGQYQPNSASTACFACSESFPSTLQLGTIRSSDCVTGPGSYRLEGARKPCPIGANCTNLGLELETLPLLAGYWRSSEESLDIIRCTRPQYCIGGAYKQEERRRRRQLQLQRNLQIVNSSTINNGSDICLQYHEGVMCYACVPGAIKRGALKLCSICDEAALREDTSKMGGIIFGIIVLITALLWAFCLHTRTQFRIAAVREAEMAAKHKATSKVGAEEGGNDNQPGTQPYKPSKYYTRFFDTVDVTVQLKIIIGLFQVIGGMSIAFSASLPPFFRTVADVLALLSFDLFSTFDFGCALPDQSHFATLLVSTLTPIGLIIVVLLCDFIVRVTILKGQEGPLKELDIVSYTIVLLVLFLIYPSVSATILKTFDCKTFGEVIVLGSDLATTCTSE